MNPPLRPSEGSAIGWGRFDTFGGRTIYLGASQDVAYSEVLSPAKRNLNGVDPLAKDAAALNMSLKDFIELVSKDWAEAHHMKPGHVATQWRLERKLFRLRMPKSGWWVDMESANSMAAIASGIGLELAVQGVTQVDRSVVLSPNRGPTVAMATWIRSLTLDDGSRPLGATWESRYGFGRVWAYWMRRVDDGLPVSSGAVTTIGEGATISRDGAAIGRVAEAFGIHIW